MVHRQARQASYHPINPRANKMAQLSPESTLLIVRAMFPFVGGVYRLSDDDQCLVEAARLTGGRGNILANMKRARSVAVGRRYRMLRKIRACCRYVCVTRRCAHPTSFPYPPSFGLQPLTYLEMRHFSHQKQRILLVPRPCLFGE